MLQKQDRGMTVFSIAIVTLVVVACTVAQADVEVRWAAPTACEPHPTTGDTTLDQLHTVEVYRNSVHDGSFAASVNPMPWPASRDDIFEISTCGGCYGEDSSTGMCAQGYESDRSLPASVPPGPEPVVVTIVEVGDPPCLDSDGDTVCDDDDDCPNEFGDPANNGCPVSTGNPPTGLAVSLAAPIFTLTWAGDGVTLDCEGNTFDVVGINSKALTIPPGVGEDGLPAGEQWTCAVTDGTDTTNNVTIGCNNQGSCRIF